MLDIDPCLQPETIDPTLNYISFLFSEQVFLKGNVVMLAMERQKRIQTILREKKVVRVDELAKELNVSEMTIRRDLEKCEREGVVERCYGGAVIRSKFVNEVLYPEKSSKNIEAKQKIADYASSMIHDGTAVYLDSGTTVFEVAKRMVRMQDLTVVTNDLTTAMYLINQTSFRIIIIGGSIQNNLCCTHGNLSEQMLSNIKVDISFSGGLAVDENLDLFLLEERKSTFRRLLLKQSRDSYLLLDHSKFMKISLFKVHSTAEYTGVITDREFDDVEKKLADEKGVNLISV